MLQNANTRFPQVRFSGLGIHRGVYQLAELAVLGDPDLSTVALKIPHGVICLISALAFHEITTQIPHEIYVAVSRGTTRPRLDCPPLRIFWFTDKAFTEGIETHIGDGVSVRVYSPEKPSPTASNTGIR